MKSENNFKNGYNSDSSKSKHYLLNKNDLTLDDIQKKTNDDNNVQDELLKQIENLKTTETDMMVGYLANKEKLVNDSEIKPYTKSNNNYYQHTKLTESINDMLKDDDKEKDNNTEKPKVDFFNTTNDKHEEDKHKNSESEPEFKTKEEENLAKLDMLRKLGELVNQYNVKLSQVYNMNSDIKAMRFEYELHKSIRDKHNKIKWMSNTLLNLCWGIEMANENYNPFDFHLDGWSSQMNRDIKDYYDVFGDLYEKYFKAGKKLPPELTLMFMIGGSAVQFHLQKSFMSGLPSLGQTLDNNPDITQKLREQAQADKMRQMNQSNDIYEKELLKQQEIALQKAKDLELLKKQEEEYKNRMNNLQNQQYQAYGQNNVFQKQQKLAELQNKLQQQASDTKSTIQNRQIPQIIRPTTINNQQQNNQQRNNQTNNQPVMSPPIIPSSMRKQQEQMEILRQKQILEHKKQLKEDNKSDDLSSYEGSSVKLNPDIDNIINKNIKNISNSSTSSKINLNDDDNSVGSVISIGSQKRRKRKGIRIE